MKNKKSQMSHTHIFTYALMAFVVVLLLGLAYRWIRDSIIPATEKAEFLQFEAQLKNYVKLNKPYGGYENVDLDVPGNYNKVCFVSSEKVTDPSFSLSGTGYNIIENSVKDGIKKNVFLVKENAEESFFVDGIKVDKDLEPGLPNDDNFGCIDIIAGKIRIKFEGEGDKTVISTFS